PDALIQAQRKQVVLDLAEQEVVARLNGIEPRKPQPVACPQRFRQLPGLKIRTANVTGLAAFDNGIEGAESLVDRCFRIRSVDLIKVYVVGLQAAKARVDRRQNVFPREADVIRARSHLHSAFGREHEIVSLAAKPTTHDLLGPSGRLE